MTGRVAAAAVDRVGIGAGVAAGAAAASDRVALAVDGGHDLTFGAWDARSNALARGLVARGVGGGTRIGLLFDGRQWADFAVAHLGVLRAGGVAVLLSPGAAPADLARAVAHSGVDGLLSAGAKAAGAVASVAGPGALPSWVAHPDEVAGTCEPSPFTVPVEAGALAELTYLAAPLAVPSPWGRSHEELARGVRLVTDGVFVHAWAPGSLGGRHAIRLMWSGSVSVVAAAGAFEADRFCSVLAAQGATGCGLTPASAAALVATGSARREQLSSVAEVLLSGPAGEEVIAGLGKVFPLAGIELVDQGAGPAVSPEQDRPGPVAVSQEGMLWHEQFAPGSFNLPCLVRRYEGPLDPAALESALSELVRRHEPLRTTFAVVDGAPRQVVHDAPAPALELATTDLAGMEPAARDAEAARIVSDATSRPFDLATGPLFAPRLVRLGEHDHLLVVRLHHTVFDDWSVDVFRRELSALYAAALDGAPTPLVDSATTFADVARRQHRRLFAEGGALRSWWGSELDGAPLAVQLPIGDAGGDGWSSAPGEPLRLDLPPALAAGVRELAPRLRATPFMTVLAAFSVLVARATGLDDLVMATVVAHRNATDVEPLIGCFTKKVPLRLRVQGDPTFGDLVARTRASLLGGLAHQDVGFEAAVQEGLGRPAADHGVVPQVAVVFQGETPQLARLALPGLTTSRYDAGAAARRERHFSAGPEAAADAGPAWGGGIYLGTFLILSLLDTPDGMALVARGVFARAAVQRLLEDFVALLAGAAADPGRPISQLGPPPETTAPASIADVVELRGFRAKRSDIDAALARCPGVADAAVAVRPDVDGAPCLVAYVVTEDGVTEPTIADLRRALWGDLPGVLLPVALVVVDVLPRLAGGELDVDALAGAGVPGRQIDPDPMAVALAAMWAEIAGRPVDVDTSYWQDFSFLQVLAEAREAGLPIADEQVVRCRTPATLAAAMAAAMAAAARRPPD